MPAAKLSTSGSLNAMNSEEDLIGWPVITPVKPQTQKCEKCSLEFCSPINYRRHIRVHRRSLNVDKESHIKREVLGAFWDKLSVKEAKEIVLFNGVMLKEIPGTSVVRGLASSLRKPGAWTLPQVYMRAGSSLVGIIMTKPSRLPISSQELFGILDEASERTFLCAGTAESLQKYLFDAETATSMLELKNLVASTGFLFEQQLVKAWVADKDAQALRCQKLLVEEEEASKKRLAELSERRKQKKIRQKEHKLKEQFHGCKGDFNVANEFDATDTPVLAVASGPPSSSDSISNSKDGSANVDYCLESQQFQIKNSEEDIEAQIDFSNDCTIIEDSQNIGPPMVGEHGHQHLATSGLQVSNSPRQCSSDCTIEEDNQTIGALMVSEQHDHQHLTTSGLQVLNSQRHYSSDCTIEEDSMTIGSPMVGEHHDHQHLATSGLQVSNSQMHCNSDGTIEEDNLTIGSPMVGEQHDHQHLATSGLQVSNSQRHCSSDCTIEEDSQTIGSPMESEKNDHQHLTTSGLQVSNSQRHCSSDCAIEEDSQTIGPPMVGEHGHQHLVTSSLQVSNSQPESTQKNSLSKNDEIDSNGECLKASLQGEACCETNNDNCEVMIGSISITVSRGATLKQQFDPSDGQGTSGQQLAIEKLSICDTVELDTNRIGPVTPGEIKGIGAIERGDGGVVLKRVGDRIVPGDCIEEVVPFSSIVATAKEFMARRWKEAISGDHVKLNLSSAS